MDLMPIGILFFFLSLQSGGSHGKSKVLAPLALKVFGGWVPWVVGEVEEDSSFVFFFLACLASSNRDAFNKGASSDDALRKRGYKQISLIPADKQPGVELLHAQVNVVLFAAKKVDPKDLT